MKKNLCCFLVLVLAVAARAEIYVTFLTSFGFSDRSAPNGSVPLLVTGQQALVQLISAGANGVVDGPAGFGGAVAGDDVILYQGLTGVATTGDFSYEYGVFDLVIVRSSFYPGGNIYGRIFQDAAARGGSYYYEGHVFTAADAVVGIPPGPPAQTYDLGQGYIALANRQLPGSPQVTLQVVSDHGAVVPPAGSNEFFQSDALVCSATSPSVDGANTYLCTGWTGTGDVPASGSSTSTGEFILNQDSSITWNWALGYPFDITVNGNGIVNVADGVYLAGSNLALTASPASGWLFMGWSGDLTGGYAATSLNLAMNGAKNVTATFSDDADGDGLTNVQEAGYGTNPRGADSDSDGLPDPWEVGNGTNPLANDADNDTDNDGLTNAQEFSLGTDPLDSDSDGDGLLDGWEVAVGTNPLVADPPPSPSGISLACLYGVAGNGNLGGIVDDTAGGWVVVQLLSMGPNQQIDSGLYDRTGSLVNGGDDILFGQYLFVATGNGYSDFSDWAFMADGRIGGAWTPSDVLYVRVIGLGVAGAGWTPGAYDAFESVYGSAPDTSGPPGSRFFFYDNNGDGTAVVNATVAVSENPIRYVDVSVTGSGTVNPPSGWFGEGTNLALSASPDAGWLFMGWSGDLVGGYQTASTNLVVNGSKTIVATFSDDADGDGLINTQEAGYGTNPRKADTDSDGLPDPWEVGNGTNPLANDAGADTDDDGLTNAEEYAAGTSPINTDSDGDGMTDGWEVANGLNPAGNDAASDVDGDQLTALQELGLGTDPNAADSDDDGLTDSEEVKNIVAWGDNFYKQTVVSSNVVNAVAIAAGGAHGLALLADGKIVGWGDNYYQQCNAPASGSNAIAIAAGETHSLAVLASGNVSAWGDNYYQQCNVPSSATNIVAASAGVEHSMALRADGRVVVWGNNYHGVRDVPPSVTNAVQIAAGGYHNLALLANGRVEAWGDNTFGACNVPPAVTNAIAIAAGGYHSLAVLPDGRVVAWGQDDMEQTSVPRSVAGATDVAAGGYHSLALLIDGTAISWGNGFYGLKNIPARVKYPVALAAGRFFSMALLNPTTPLDPDSDDDGLADGEEVKTHKTDPLDPDCDRDGILDGDEILLHGTSPFNADSDGDGMPDGWEVTYGLQPTANDAGSDKDEDLLSNLQEYGLGTSPDNPDSDGDGLSDGAETNVHGTDPLNPDSDGDGLTDGAEVNTHGTQPLVADSDGDGLSDGAEVSVHGTDPLKPDSDGDGLSDGAETNVHGTDPLNPDSDDDGLGDGSEINVYFSHPLDPDCDADGLLDGQEVLLGTGLFNADSDGDGLLDGTEVNVHGTDPLNPDSDGDGLGDGAELGVYGTNPLNGDTDGDTFGDGQEAANGGSPLVSDFWRIEHIRNNGSAYDLYPSNSVVDLSIGQAAFEVTNGTAWLSLQLEESTDLVVWTNAGDEVIWSIPVDLGKAFYRVRSGR